MRSNSKIITIGLCPCWDITCRGEALAWGGHKVISSTDSQPAGKALNISRALAWMGTKSIAAGLWGRQDERQMLEAVRSLRESVKVKLTAVEGRTRDNITIIDTAKNREMHLRAVSRLASKKAMRKLKSDLEKIVTRNSVCVFAGAMPKQFLGDVAAIIDCCRESGAKIVLDTSGPALRKIVASGKLWLIKPNVQELSELLGGQVKDTVAGLVKAGRKLLDKVEIVLISRGKKGAVAVTKEAAWQGQCTGNRKAVSTVACGDYLLAGFLKGIKDNCDITFALQTALVAATAKAWGITEQTRWAKARHKIRTEIKLI
jgi:1-phosphofructokinase family hexose kinase